MGAEIGARVGFERQRHHGRPEVGAADADVDDVGELLAGIAANSAIAHLVGEHLHAREHIAHARHHVLAVDHHLVGALITQRHVQHRAIFGRVDVLARPHTVAPRLDFNGARQIEQRLHCHRINAVL